MEPVFGNTGGKTAMELAFEKADQENKIHSGQKSKAAENGKPRYSIKYDKNNTPYVEVESDILHDVPKKVGQNNSKGWRGPSPNICNGFLAFIQECTKKRMQRIPLTPKMSLAVGVLYPPLTVYPKMLEKATFPSQKMENPGGGELLDLNVVASAYGKDTNLPWFIQNSQVLYLEPNKNRTENWLQSVGLQLPSDAVPFDPVGSVTYLDGKVKIVGTSYQQLMQRQKNSPRVSVQEKRRRSGMQRTCFTNIPPGMTRRR